MSFITHAHAFSFIQGKPKKHFLHLLVCKYIHLQVCTCTDLHIHTHVLGRMCTTKNVYPEQDAEHETSIYVRVPGSCYTQIDFVYTCIKLCRSDAASRAGEVQLSHVFHNHITQKFLQLCMQILSTRVQV